jgi:hypothetical protein
MVGGMPTTKLHGVDTECVCHIAHNIERISDLLLYVLPFRNDQKAQNIQLSSFESVLFCIMAIIDIVLRQAIGGTKNLSRRTIESQQFVTDNYTQN